MESTPPSCRIKSASRLSDDIAENVPLNIAPSPLHLNLQTSNSKHGSPLQELLLLSPSPLRRPKSRQGERMDVEEAADVASSRRRCKGRALSASLMGCGSPKNGRRSRRQRPEQESREARDLGFGEENGKVRKRRSRTLTAPRREKLSSAPSIPSPSLSPKTRDDDWSSIDGVKQMISELIMWKDVAKSSLWFGFGSLCFLSSCFARGMSFSIISAASQLGLLFLGISFFYNLFSQRHEDDARQAFKLKEDDIVCAARLMLPAANAALAMTRELFSGEPSMTLKIASMDSLRLPRSFIADGTTSSFCIRIWLYDDTVEAFCHCFLEGRNLPFDSCNPNMKELFLDWLVESLKSYVGDAWAACAHKRIVAASAATVFWNLSTTKTRIFAAFIFVVALQYYRQQQQPEEAVEEEHQQQQQLAMVVVEKEKQKEPEQLEMAVADGPSDGST
ncbi:hypothetical protein ACLOJK_009816 [Asimina triloba]